MKFSILLVLCIVLIATQFDAAKCDAYSEFCNGLEKTICLDYSKYCKWRREDGVCRRRDYLEDFIGHIFG